MKRTTSMLVFLVILLGTTLATTAFGRTSITITGSVFVTCPFGVTFSTPQPVYLQPTNIVFNFDIVTTTPCSIGSLPGNIIIANTVTTAVYYDNSVSISGISNSPTSGTFDVPSSLIPQSADTATLNLGTNYTTSNSVSIQVISSANVAVVSLQESPLNPTQGSQITVTTNVFNDGSLASSNMVLNISISGPQSFQQYNSIVMSSLSPTQSEVSNLDIGSATQNPGTYTLSVFVSYQTSFTQGGNTYTANQISNIGTISYTVPGGQNSQGNQSGGNSGKHQQQPPPTNIGMLEITQMPIFTTILSGGSTVQIIGFTNTANVPLWVNLTTPTFSFGKVSFSASSVYMYPQQEEFIQILLSSNANVAAASQLFPINFTVTSQGSLPTTGQMYLMWNVKSNGNLPTFLRTTTLSNESKSALTSISVLNPTGNSIYGTVVSTQIPWSLVSNSDFITLIGEIPNITTYANQFVLKWKIPVLQPYSTVQLQYSINNISRAQYFYSAPITIMSQISPSNLTGIKVFEITAPTFLVNQKNNITVGYIYSGTNQANVTLDLVPPLNVVVYNQVQKYYEFPNAAHITKFQVGPISGSGTYIFQLLISAPFGNQTFSIPIVVLQNTTAPPQQTNSNSTTTGLLSKLPYQGALIPFVLAAIIMIGAYAFYRRATMPQYNQARAEKLLRLKQRIKREDEQGGD